MPSAVATLTKGAYLSGDNIQFLAIVATPVSMSVAIGLHTVGNLLKSLSPENNNNNTPTSV